APPFEAHRGAAAVFLEGCRWRGGCLDYSASKRECAPKQSEHADPHHRRFATLLEPTPVEDASVSLSLPSLLEAKEIRVQSENALGNIPFYLSRHDLSCCHDYLRGYGDTVPTQHSWNCNHTAGPAHMVLSYLASAPRRLGRALIKVYRHGF